MPTMTGLVGRHLEEMADMRSERKRRIVVICSAFSFVILLGYTSVHMADHNYLFSILNLTCALCISVNTWYALTQKEYNVADVILSGILLFYATMLIFYGGMLEDRLFWLYPILAAVILINDFRIGVLFSGATNLLIVCSMLFSDVVELPAGFATDRFIVSLLVLSLACNMSAYYYARAINYIQSLYTEGIEDLAYLDQLTGLANRWSFENWAHAKLEEVKDSSSLTALVFLDIDDFKAINDTYGHSIGDRVLQHFASRLKNNVRNKDRRTDKHDYSIARFAGDEFVLLLYGVKTKKDLDGILARISHLFEDSYQSSERINRLTISIGAALYPTDADNLEELTRCADKAMYTAKHSGKNQFNYYQGDRLNPLKEFDDTTATNVTPLKTKGAKHLV